MIEVAMEVGRVFVRPGTPFGVPVSAAGRV
jgi:hypothetical protein